MKKLILLLIFTFAVPVFATGDLGMGGKNAVSARKFSSAQRRRKKKRERHIWQKNSQRRKHFLCRDGAISHSKGRRGACSGHRGILRQL